MTGGEDEEPQSFTGGGPLKVEFVGGPNDGVITLVTANEDGSPRPRYLDHHAERRTGPPPDPGAPMWLYRYDGPEAAG